MPASIHDRTWSAVLDSISESTTPSPGSTFYYFLVTARLADGVSIEAARAELATIEKAFEDHEPPSAFERTKPEALLPVVMSLHDRLYGDTKKPLLLLFAAVARAAAHRVRQCRQSFPGARGATRTRIRRAPRAGRESVATRCGTCCRRVCCCRFSERDLGSRCRSTAVRYFVRLSPKSVGRVEGIQIDGRVLLFTLLAAVVTGILFGLVPARVGGEGKPRRSLVERQPACGRDSCASDGFAECSSLGSWRRR